MKDTPIRVRFNIPYYPEHASTYLDQVVSGDEAKADQAAALLQRYSLGSQVFLTGNCSSAILMSLIIADVRAGDEVIVSSYTFVTVVNAIRLLGGVPVYADIESASMNLDAMDVERRITAKTKSIIFMSYGGDSTGLAPIKALAVAHDLLLIEDAAYGYMMEDVATSRPVGTIGDMACMSFDRTKPYQCVQGGALIVNNANLIDKAHDIYNYGTNRSAHMAGHTAYYEWVSLGFKFQMNALNACVLTAVLQQSQEIKQMLWGIYQHYSDMIHECPWYGVQPQYTNQFLLVCSTPEVREALKKLLLDQGVQAFSHYEPLHVSPYGKAFCDGALPVTEVASKKVLRLPFYPGLNAEDQAHVCEALKLANAGLSATYPAEISQLEDRM